MPTYVLYADEAYTHDDGLNHRRFYGGCLVESRMRAQYDSELRRLKDGLGLEGRLKWNKARPAYIDRYYPVIDRFLEWVADGSIKLRIMWLPQQAIAADTEHFDQFGYYILYYFFVIRGFGLNYHNEEGMVRVEFLPDTLPDEPLKKANFTRFLMNAHRTGRFREGSRFEILRVGEVAEENHMLLQCVDIIIGSFGFLLNDCHLAKDHDGKTPERAALKEALARHIVSRIDSICRAQSRESHRLNEDTKVGYDTRTANPIFSNNWCFDYRQWRYRHSAT